MNSEKDVTVSVRVNSLTYVAAQDRAELAGIKLPDIIRAAYESVAAGDAAAFNCGLYRIVAGNDKYAQTAWLSRRARDLFYERDGVLFGKSDRGSRKADMPVGTVNRGGLPCVSVDAKYVPVRDVVFALNNACWSGRVLNMNDDTADNRPENLALVDDNVDKNTLNIDVSPQTLKAVVSGNQKAIIYHLPKMNSHTVSIITSLVIGGSFTPVLLSDGNKQTVRRAIHAAAVGESDYLISLS